MDDRASYFSLSGWKEEKRVGWCCLGTGSGWENFVGAVGLLGNWVWAWWGVESQCVGWLWAGRRVFRVGMGIFSSCYFLKAQLSDYMYTFVMGAVARAVNMNCGRKRRRGDDGKRSVGNSGFGHNGATTVDLALFSPI